MEDSKPVCIYIYTHTHIYTHLCTFIHINTCTYICIHTYTYTWPWPNRDSRLTHYSAEDHIYVQVYTNTTRTKMKTYLYKCIHTCEELTHRNSCLAFFEGGESCNHTHLLVSWYTHPPTGKNGLIALWPNTRVVKCKYSVSQKQNGFNNRVHWYNILLTFIYQFMDRL